MLTISIGQRYERLLFWAAPITLATIAVLLIQLGFARSQPLNEARCIEFAATAFEKRLPNINKYYQKYRKKKDKFYQEMYLDEYKIALISHLEPDGCEDYIQRYLAKNWTKNPNEVISDLRNIENKLKDSPLSVYGIEIPQATQFDLLGNKLKIPVPTLAAVAQIALLPILLLWLGSLYHTRFREAHLISRATTIAEVFPHLINLFPVGKLESPRKRDFVLAHQTKIIGGFFSGLRFLLLTVFVIPPTAAYVWSLWLSANEDNFILPIIAGIFVVMFLMQTAFYEFSTPLFSKIFSDEDRQSGL